MTTRYKTITVDPAGVAVAEAGPCTCACAAYHPDATDVCTTVAESGAVRCSACVEADIDHEPLAAGTDVELAGDDLTWLAYEQIGAAA